MNSALKRLASHLLAFLFVVSALTDATVANAQGTLFDSYPGAKAAYSLRKVSSSYGGPAIKVRHGGNGSLRDFGFTPGGDLDVAAIEAWLAGSDGFVNAWYDQVSGGSALVQGQANLQPTIALAGKVIMVSGRPAIRFATRTVGMGVDGAAAIALNNYSLFVTTQQTPTLEEQDFVGINTRGRYHEGAAFRGSQSYVNGGNVRLGGPLAMSERSVFILRNNGTTADLWQGNTKTDSKTNTAGMNNAVAADYRQVGGFTGTLCEFIVYPALADGQLMSIYSNMSAYWKAGASTWNANALLPQQYPYQVGLYDWLETITVADVTLPSGTFSWDGNMADVDQLADLWLLLQGATASRVVRGEPDWYVLNAGNGKGIEATGEVRVWHEPGAGYSGNPPRSWANEPAFLYQLSIPRGSGSNGNPYYQNRAMGLRALVVAATDMMMYHKELLTGGYGSWMDMYGKAMLSWAEAYRWTKNLLSPETRAYFEAGFGYFLDEAIKNGPRAVNTNMDTFFIQGAANVYMAADDPALKTKALQAVKKVLLGHPDGELGVKHDVFAAGPTAKYGVFDPSGFIMEGDQPDMFYMGESMYHLAGALAIVSNPTTGAVPAEWSFLDEVLRRIVEWVTYQSFSDPSSNGKYVFQSGAGFSGRTGHGAPYGQAGELWKHVMLADRYPDWAFNASNITSHTAATMRSAINGYLASLNQQMSSTHVGTPNAWNGWSPWVKPTPYLPTRGWYTRLVAAFNQNNPSTQPPTARSGHYFNKAFGGYPTGFEYWAYKNAYEGREWGFFVEAQARQGDYGGWYGGKIETFWTRDTGVILVNRHGKSGCDGAFEDARCWTNIEWKAGHRVWGRDENGKGFETLQLKGRLLQRTSTFNVAGSTPSVTVWNLFNDPTVPPTSQETGEETGSELQGRVEVTNKFEALASGVRVTHTITSDGTDQIKELWASLPIYLRHYNPLREGTDEQKDLSDTSIEYWDGTSWRPLPGDVSGDGIPEITTTTALRLGRDFKLGQGMRYAYVSFPEPERVRLSTQVYYDPYQTKTSVRTVHIDLHGSPGTVKNMPASTEVVYELTVADPSQNDPGSSGLIQRVDLVPGWNLVSSFVQPDEGNLDQLFASFDGAIHRVEDASGKVYSPADGLNQIGPWQAGVAYKVFADRAVTLEFSGSAPASPLTLNLVAGRNWLPSPVNSVVAIEDALAPILDKVIMVSDENGYVFHRGLGIRTLDSLRPGRAYVVQMSAPAQITIGGS